MRKYLQTNNNLQIFPRQYTCSASAWNSSRVWRNRPESRWRRDQFFALECMCIHSQLPQCPLCVLPLNLGSQRILWNCLNRDTSTPLFVVSSILETTIYIKYLLDHLIPNIILETSQIMVLLIWRQYSMVYIRFIFLNHGETWYIKLAIRHCHPVTGQLVYFVLCVS